MWLATFAIVTLQRWLPLNPDGIGNMEPTLAFNTISSFTTNTNLQHYSGETGLSYLSQMIAITFLQFVTAATGMAACVAIIRGLAGNRLKHARQLLRRPDARRRCGVFLPLALLVGGRPDVAGHADDVPGRGEGDDASKGRSRRSRAASSRPRSPSSSSARTAAATSGRTRRIRTRTRRRSPTSSRPGRSRSSRWRWSGRSGYMVGRRRLAVVVFVDDAGAVPPDGDRSASRRSAAATRRSPPWASISRPARWRARRSASAPGSPRSGP